MGLVHELATATKGSSAFLYALIGRVDGGKGTLETMISFIVKSGLDAGRSGAIKRQEIQ